MARAVRLSEGAYDALRCGAARAAGRWQPKVIAGAVGLTDAGVRKIRDGSGCASLKSFVRLMALDPDLAADVERWAARLRQGDLFDTPKGDRS